jgi:hypothetical protein
VLIGAVSIGEAPLRRQYQVEHTRTSSTTAQLSPTTESPLDIIAFNSDQGISIANNGPTSVYVLSLDVSVSEPQLSKSFGLGLDIDAGKIQKYPIHDGFQKVRSLNKLADTWKQHFERAEALYEDCGIQLTFFAPDDPGFQQMVAFHSQHGQGLSYDTAKAVLRYRVSGLNERKEQPVKIVVTATVNDATCRRYQVPN